MVNKVLRKIHSFFLADSIMHYPNMIKHCQLLRLFKSKTLNHIDKIKVCSMVSMKLYSYRSLYIFISLNMAVKFNAFN